MFVYGAGALGEEYATDMEQRERKALIVTVNQ
jgi:hypothetical protein